MTFEYPARLLLLLALIPAILLTVINYKRRFSRIYSLLGSSPVIFYDDVGLEPEAGKLPMRTELRLRYIGSNLFFIVFFVCMAFALAGPRGGVRFVRETRQGADIVFAFDLSRSMDARDAPPYAPGGLSSSRLESSVYTAKAMTQNLLASSAAGDIRFGAAIGKGEAVLAIPLTGNTEALFALLDSLSVLAMTSRGTNLEKLLDTASSAFQDSFPSARYVALFSDGETLSGSVAAAAERLRQKDVKLLACGAGSVYGAAVPETERGETGHPSERSATPIISYLRTDILSAAAERTGGLFVESGVGAAAEMAGFVRSNGLPEDVENAWTLREESGDRRRPFIIAGLAAFIISKLFSLKLKKPPARKIPFGRQPV